MGTLQEVKGASLVQGISFDPSDPDVCGPDIFTRLVPLPTHEAASLYSEEKAKLLRKVLQDITSKDNELATYLSSLQLDPDLVTTAAKAVSHTQDPLPPALLDSCALLSSDSGAPARLSKQLQSLAEKCIQVGDLVTEVGAMLEQENKKETLYQQQVGKRPNAIMSQLQKEYQKLTEAHAQARDSNLVLRQQLASHVPNLHLLSGPLEQVEQQLPSAQDVAVDEAAVTEVQRLMAKVEEMRKQRQMLEDQFREALQQDDITKALIIKDEKEDLQALFSRELDKHKPVVTLLEQNMAAQEKILKALTQANANFADTRRALLDILAKRTSKIDELLASYKALFELTEQSQKGLEFFGKLAASVGKLKDRVRGVAKVQEEERVKQLTQIPPQAYGAPGPKPAAYTPKLKDYLPYMGQHMQNLSLTGGMVPPFSSTSYTPASMPYTQTIQGKDSLTYTRDNVPVSPVYDGPLPPAKDPSPLYSSNQMNYSQPNFNQPSQAAFSAAATPYSSGASTPVPEPALTKDPASPYVPNQYGYNHNAGYYIQQPAVNSQQIFPTTTTDMQETAQQPPTYPTSQPYLSSAATPTFVVTSQPLPSSYQTSYTAPAQQAYQTSMAQSSTPAYMASSQQQQPYQDMSSQQPYISQVYPTSVPQPFQFSQQSASYQQGYQSPQQPYHSGSYQSYPSQQPTYQPPTSQHYPPEVSYQPPVTQTSSHQAPQHPTYPQYQAPVTQTSSHQAPVTQTSSHQAPQHPTYPQYQPASTSAQDCYGYQAAYYPVYTQATSTPVQTNSTATYQDTTVSWGQQYAAVPPAAMMPPQQRDLLSETLEPTPNSPPPHPQQEDTWELPADTSSSRHEDIEIGLRMADASLDLSPIEHIWDVMLANPAMFRTGEWLTGNGELSLRKQSVTLYQAGYISSPDCAYKHQSASLKVWKMELIKDRVVVGIHDDHTREKLLSDPDLDLDKAIQICMAAERTNKEIKVLQQRSDQEVSVIKKNYKDFWECLRDKDMERIKDLLKQAPTLKYYDPNKDVVLSVDASQHAIGAVLLQEDRPIAYASSALNDAQRHYPQIEKEALAIKFGCKKFHTYIYGKSLLIETDHRPLESIYKKPMDKMPPRLQKIFMEINQYGPNIKYKSGKELLIADLLSRDCQSYEILEENPIEILLITAFDNRSTTNIMKATKEDAEF
ncbi:PTPN23 [Cordylochernes scorpioides]|uniref:PTPN23 n=1 Tax=Cordylochernes scorpioides TaxID=51811 RepID=A0ABY6K5P6_9ARAC|nr:PTPN23 [Cordylochernes scorpioides]